MKCLVIVGIIVAIALCGLYAIGVYSLNQERMTYEEFLDLLEKIEESVDEMYLYLAEKSYKEDMDDGSDDLPKFGD